MWTIIKLSFLVYCLFVILEQTSAQNIVQYKLGGLPAEKDDISSDERLHFEQPHTNVTDFVRSFSKSKQMDIDNLLKVIQSSAISVDCSADVLFLFDNLIRSRKYSPLTLQYIDASSKIPNGILEGHWIWAGDTQECHEISSVENPVSRQSFKGQYFVSTIYIDGKQAMGIYPLMLGLCLPDSCNETDVNYLVSEGFSELKDEIAKYMPSLANKTIYANGTVSDKPRELDSGAKAMVAVISLIVCVVFISSVVDYLTTTTTKEEEYMIQRDVTVSDPADRTGLLAGELFSPSIETGRDSHIKTHFLKLCQSFSAVSNGKKLFSTTTASGPLACLNGIRVMSMWWVILGHTYELVPAVGDNLLYVEKFTQRFTFQPIMNGTFSVDSFFFLSGLLVAYLALNEIQQKGKISWIYFVLHRYWRLTPLYAFILCYYTFLMIYTISGPLSFLLNVGENEGFMDNCKSYWWTNLLYINNMYPDYGDPRSTCMGWTWYLANDMQFYLVFGPMFIILFSRWRRVGVGVSLFFIIVCISVRAFLAWYYGVYALITAATKHKDDPWGRAGALYGRPYARWSVYIVGMMTGYVLSVTKNRIKIHKIFALLGWCCAIATGLAVVYGQYYYNHNPPAKMTTTASVFYISLCRTAWGLCLAWIVLACVSGNGGPVKDILSWTCWAPLGRLTYSAYLVHPVVMTTFYYGLKETLHATDLGMIYIFIGHLVISYALAFVVSMLVEAPMIQLEKLLLKPAGTLGSKIVGGICNFGNRLRTRLT
ncbi:hypothetical protein ACF0H5_002163 [Mactra antiquata]